MNINLLIHSTAPGPVTNLTYNSTNSQLTWDQPTSGCKPLLYIMDWRMLRSLDEDCDTAQDTSWQRTSKNEPFVSLQNVPAFTTYAINVTSQNQIGNSVSKSIVFDTPETGKLQV